MFLMQLIDGIDRHFDSVTGLGMNGTIQASRPLVPATIIPFVTTVLRSGVDAGYGRYGYHGLLVAVLRTSPGLSIPPGSARAAGLRQ